MSRCIPGIRVYVTLVAGAAEVPLGLFMRAAIPAAVVWTTLLLAVGMVVGVPAAHFFSAIEKLAFSGGLLVLLGLIAYRAARRSPERWHARAPFAGMASPHRIFLAFLVDAGVVAVIAAGFDRITRSVLQIKLPQISFAQQYDFLLIGVALAISYVVASRRGGSGETAGERVFDVSYVHAGRRSRGPDDEASTDAGGQGAGGIGAPRRAKRRGANAEPHSD